MSRLRRNISVQTNDITDDNVISIPTSALSQMMEKWKFTEMISEMKQSFEAYKKSPTDSKNVVTAACAASKSCSRASADVDDEAELVYI